MGYGVGQTESTNTTGVGAAQNSNGATGQPSSFGKGGGTVTQPTTTSNALAEPAQSSTNPYATTVPANAPTVKPAPTPVFGQNAFGYNMGRLAQRMDPSATLPKQQAQPAQQPAQPAQQTQQASGGKGGGYADLPLANEFISSLIQPYPTQQTPYGVTGSTGAEDYNAANYYGNQGATNQNQMPQYANPFSAQNEMYQQQMQSMQNVYERQLDMLQKQMEKMQDTGSQIYAMPKAYQDYGYTTTGEQEKVAEEKKATPAEVPKPAPAKITQGVQKASSQSRNIGEGQIIKVDNWYVYKDPDTGTQMKTKSLSTAETNSGGTYTKPVKAAPAQTLQIGQGAGTSVVKAAPAKASKKKAHGGVIHDGMSKRLKHMLGED